MVDSIKTHDNPSPNDADDKTMNVSLADDAQGARVVDEQVDGSSDAVPLADRPVISDQPKSSTEELVEATDATPEPKNNNKREIWKIERLGFRNRKEDRKSIIEIIKNKNIGEFKR